MKKVILSLVLLCLSAMMTYAAPPRPKNAKKARISENGKASASDYREGLKNKIQKSR